MCLSTLQLQFVSPLVKMFSRSSQKDGSGQRARKQIQLELTTQYKYNSDCSDTSVTVITAYFLLITIYVGLPPTGGILNYTNYITLLQTSHSARDVAEFENTKTKKLAQDHRMSSLKLLLVSEQDEMFVLFVYILRMMLCYLVARIQKTLL